MEVWLNVGKNGSSANIDGKNESSVQVEKNGKIGSSVLLVGLVVPICHHRVCYGCVRALVLRYDFN